MHILFTAMEIEYDDDDVRRDSKCCMSLLVVMDAVHLVYNVVLLALFGKDSTSLSFYVYDVVAALLSANGIWFNIFIRTLWGLTLFDKVLAKCTKWSCLRLSDSSRELLINVCSVAPTLSMVVFGQCVIWLNSTDGLAGDALGISAWITAWLYVVKVYGFSRYIVDLKMHYRL
jgi:hypothetical protein